MKKLMMVLATVMLMLPVVVKADTYKTYSQGEEVNFYAFDSDEVGKTSIILEDKGSADQYVKAWFTGISGTGQDFYADPKLGEAATPFESTGAYKILTSHLNAVVQGFGGHAKDISQAGNLQLITLEELISVFGATKTGEIYTIDVNTWGTKFSKLVTSANGIFTQTVEGDNVWVVKLTRGNDSVSVTSITVEKVPYATTTLNDYAVSPVVYVDKTYDCLEDSSSGDYACYICGEDYTWVLKGSEADTCTIVDDITAKSKCVKSPDTGMEEYILEFVAIAGVCAVAIIIAKRKDLFRNI